MEIKMHGNETISVQNYSANSIKEHTEWRREKKKEREEPSSPKKEEVGWGEVQEEKEKRDGKEGAEEKHPQNY